MTAVATRGGVAVATSGGAQPPRLTDGREAVVVRVTAEDVATLHRRISVLVRKVRHKLASRADGAQHELVLDLSEVPPVPAVAPLLLLIGLLRRSLGPVGRVDVIGVNPALAGALTAFDLPDGVGLVDARGRRRAS